MTTFRTLLISVLTCLLLACGGYDDDGGLKGSSGSGSAESLETTEFFLAISLPGGESASAQRRPGKSARPGHPATRDVAANGLTLENFTAEVLVPDINEPDGFREVAVDVARFIDLGDGLYSVEIDGTPQVDTIIYVTVDNVRLKVLALSPGSRAEPVRVNFQTTVAVELFLEQVAEDDIDLDTLQIDEVQETLDDIVTYLDTVDVPADLTGSEILDYLKDEASDSCSINTDGSVAGGCNLTYHIGGQLNGLQGSLTLALQNGELLTLTSDGAFTFASVFPDATAYTVTLESQPAGQTCQIEGAEGTVTASDVTGITLTCVQNPRYYISGNATGISGNAQISLNGQEILTLTASGAFAFNSALDDGTGFTLALVSAPAGYSCTLTPEAGVIAQADVTNAALDCAPLPTFNVGGVVSGLNGVLTLALSGDAGAESLPVSSSGGFVFATSLLDAQAFAVSISAQPANQSCTLAQGTVNGVIAAASITDIVVDCVDNTYAIGGTVTGLTGTLSVLLNGTESLPVAADGTFTFTTRLLNAEAYTVTIDTQPSGQTCTIASGGAGTVAAADVTTVSISCGAALYTIGGTMSGLQGSASLLLNGIETLVVPADGAFTFQATLADAAAYQVAMIAQPAGQRCTLANAQGNVSGGNVTSITASCVSQSLSVGGTATGLEGDLLLQLQSNTTYEVLETLILNASGSYQFSQLFGTGETYGVSITYQPPGLTCVISNYSGTLASANIANVDIACTPRQVPLNFTVESAALVLPGEEIRLSGQSLDDAVFTVDATPVALKRQSNEYVSFDAPNLAVGSHVVAANGVAGSDSTGLLWAETMPSVAAVAPGNAHTCALRQDRSVMCWGDNVYGQLGNADGDLASRLVPDRVSGLGDAVELHSGAYFSCARRQNGEILCWGDNQNGQLGNGGGESNSVTPVMVGSIANAQQLSVGYDHACALLADQTVACWGNNAQGQLGNGSNTNAPAPVAVSGITNAVAVQAGTYASCAVIAGGSVRCWGENGNGQLGNGSTTGSNVPVNVSGLSGVTALAMGNAHVCALLAGGDVSCWGSNAGRQFGNIAFAAGFSSVPVQATSVSGVQAITAGNQHTCAVTGAGEVECWGTAASGEMGRGYYLVAADPLPEIVPGISGATDVVSGGNVTCALLGNQTARCFGANNAGSLGRGSLSTTAYRDYVYPSPIASPLPASGNFDAGTDSVCAITAAQGVVCIGLNDAGQLGAGLSALRSTSPVLASGIGDALQVSAGSKLNCAVMQSGQVQCWGRGQAGELGNGNFSASAIPVTVSGIATAVAVSAADSHACAVLQNGTVQCWGQNNSGQLGNGQNAGSPATSAVPVTVAGLSDAVSVAVASGTSCALRAGGTVSCWGNNDFGQLGNGSMLYSSLPLPVANVTSATALTLGQHHGCALLVNGDVQCWGAANSNTLLGDGSLGGFPRKATRVKGLPAPVVSVSAGATHSCAVLNTGSVMCWGADDFAQLGDRSNQYGWPPVRVPGISTAIAVSVGEDYSCARLQDDTLQCWGMNYSQMGPGASPVNAEIRQVPEDSTVTVTASGLVGYGLVINFAATGINEYLPVEANGSIRFTAAVTGGDGYLLSFAQQPLGQTCAFTSGQGSSTGGVAVAGTPISLALTCVDLPFTAGGNLVGLQSGTVRLLFSGVEFVTQGLDGGFQFATGLADGSEYYVGVIGQPNGQYCNVSNASGFISGQSIADIGVQCVALPYQLSGSISGLSGVMVLSNLGSGSRSSVERMLRISGDNTFAFSQAFASTDSYYLSIDRQPDGQVCTIDTGSAGSFTNGNVTDVSISCADDSNAPQVSTISPDAVLPGDRVVLEGSHLASASVTIGGQSVTPVSQSHTHLELVAPALTAGNQALVVTNATGNFNGSLLYGTELGNVASMEGGTDFTCLRMQDGSVSCQGYNGQGQLGIGSVALPGGIATVPQSVSALAGTLAISAGSAHACAIGGTNQVLCWGSNTFGALGNGTLVDSNVPTLITGLLATQLSAGGTHSCAVTLANGDVDCWGYNAYGQLGDGSVNDSAVPVQVAGISGVTAVSAGEAHSCALVGSPGIVRCWGYNGDGRLGDGTTNDSSIPVTVSGITNAVAIAAGSSHACALLATGEVRCWGSNTRKQLGNPALSADFSAMPVSVGDTVQNGVSGLVAKGNHSCGVNAAAEVLCWGSNDDGELGNGTRLASAQPVTVTGLSGITAVGAGYSHGCAIRSDGSVRCWGRGSNGELGNGVAETAPDFVYAKPISHAFDAIGSVSHFSAGVNHACAVIGGAVYCTGLNEHGQLGNGLLQASATPVQVAGISDALRAYAGFEHSCALRSNGSVVCWGSNAHGQLGAGLPAGDVLTPTAVSGLSGVAGLSVGYRHNCAVTGGGVAYCWGDNQRGGLGSGFMGGVRNVPVRVRDIGTVVQVDASGAEGSSCARLANGQVMCWGANGYGELGNGSFVDSALPIVVPGLANIADISLGGLNRRMDNDDINPTGSHCAIDSGGAVYCWGAGNAGQLGMGSGHGYQPLPVRLPLSGAAVAVDIGGAHGCAVLADTTVECWGSNAVGQLGMGINSADSRLATTVLSLTGAQSLSAGRNYTCALLNGGSVQCWGENELAQMGAGLTDVTRRVRYAILP